jgi:hypothetical protein
MPTPARSVSLESRTTSAAAHQAGGSIGELGWNGGVEVAPGVMRAPDQPSTSAQPRQSGGAPAAESERSTQAIEPRYRELDVASGVAGTSASGPPAHADRITVISGTARAGRQVASLLAAALDRDHQAGATVSDAGSIVGAPAWTAAVDSADQLILAVDAVGTGPAEAANLLDQARVRIAMTIVLLPPPRRGLSRGHEDIGAIRAHFERRTHAVLFVPNEPRSTKTSDAAWQRIVAALGR